MILAKEKYSLLFISPRFLFPADTGGAIRTTQILRGMKKNGKFSITLISPTDGKRVETYTQELDSVCDHFLSWNTPNKNGIGYLFNRARHLFSKLPIPVATDRSRAARMLVENQLAEEFDAVVFDFVHSFAIAPDKINIPSVLFTHNVETEIFKRHANVANNPFLTALWKNQFKKMLRFESNAVKSFDSVVVVSDRDGIALAEMSGVKSIFTIPTGVDLERFQYNSPGIEPHIVFSGSMDWLANIDGIEYFMDEIWPLISRAVPDAKMTVVGRHPPSSLMAKAKSRNIPWTFTGFVDDIREYIQGAAVYVIPLRVGGGTRMKAYEAMALGSPVVSTSIGVEGLPVEEGSHYLRADSPQVFSDSVVKLLRNPGLGQKISKQARAYIERKFSYENAARVFEDVCFQTFFRDQSGICKKRVHTK